MAKIRKNPFRLLLFAFGKVLKISGIPRTQGEIDLEGLLGLIHDQDLKIADRKPKRLKNRKAKKRAKI